MRGFLRVGVSGHRLLADPAKVAADVDDALDALLAGSGPEFADDVGRTAVIGVSALAEGADRIVAERILARRGGQLEVILPLDPEDYATDFVDNDSRQEFNELLLAADRVTVMPHDPSDASREAAYQRAGTATVDGSDVLFALWDGEGARGRGGTADVVAEARAKGKDVWVIPVERGVG